MMKLKNSISIIVLITSIATLSCNRSVSQKSKVNGYLNSTAFKNDLENRRDYRYNSIYSTKRMFLLLGEEGFLYNPDYEFYAVFYFVEKGVCDFYIFKSKDSLETYSTKRIKEGGSIFYVDNLNNDSLDKKNYEIEVKTKIVDKMRFQSSGDLYEKIVNSSKTKQQFHPPYDGPIRGLFLYYKNEYYLASDFNTEASVMNEMDTFFRKSLNQ